jgi:glycosyltransferase involved in cell wall biosynthesis
VRSTATLCEAMAMEGNQVEVLTTDAGLEQAPQIPRSQPVNLRGVRVTYFPKVPGLGIPSPDLEQAVSDRIREFDLIHVTGVWQRTSPAAYRAATKAGVPLVVSTRGALSLYSWTQRRWRKLVYFFLRERPGLRGAAGIHYTSKLEEQECRWYRFPGRVAVIPNPVDTGFWRRDEPGATVWRKAHGFALNDRVALYTGRLEPKKNLSFLIPVLASTTDWSLVLLGYEEREQARLLRQMAGRLGCASRLHILTSAPREVLRAAYSAADVFVLPSHHENFANAVVEAVACGCPALLSVHVGCANELESYGGARIVPTETGAWVRALNEQNLGLKTLRSGYLDLVSPENCARRMLNFYVRIQKSLSTREARIR